MGHRSAPSLLVLHAVRLKGFADTDAVAARFALNAHATLGTLESCARARWLVRSSFADLSGWALTEAGRIENERELQRELDRLDGRLDLELAHADFLPLNSVVAQACSSVQLNDAPAVYEAAWERLAEVANGLRELEARLVSVLDRFSGYHARFAAALFRADENREWLTGIEVDSCHKVWFELHEDLIATLGLHR